MCVGVVHDLAEHESENERAHGEARASGAVLLWYGLAAGPGIPTNTADQIRALGCQNARRMPDSENGRQWAAAGRRGRLLTKIEISMSSVQLYRYGCRP